MFKFLESTVKKLFGTKYDKDVALYNPIVEEINELYESYESLSHDELRSHSEKFRAQIAEHLAGIDEDIKKAREEALSEQDNFRKEELFNEVDELRKERDKELENILKQILPEAFATMKDAARRFSQNDEIIVTASQMDRDLAAGPKSDFIRIEGDKAIYKTSWLAAGGEIKWNMIHYDVQLIGGMVLHGGKIAEMQTGEGKTLVSTLPAYLNGLSGQGVHLITVNNYLALRDCEWNGPLFQFLGLSVDCIDKYKSHSAERRAAYNCDITYGTNNEFGFDYLRDNMVRNQNEMVQRKHHFTMIDEVDSVLIDDARTPLIISGPVEANDEEQMYVDLKPHVERLISAQKKLANQFLAEGKSLFKDNILGHEEGEAGLALLRAHRALPKSRPLIKFLSEEGVKVNMQKAENFYMQEQNKHMHIADEPLLFTIDEKNRQVELVEKGAEYLAKGFGDPQFFIMPNLAAEMNEIESNEKLTVKEKNEARLKLSQDFSVKSRRLHAVNQLLKAYTIFEKEEEYVVMDGQVKIVDEQTGRMMEGRRYSDGLHQALEAKEGVKVGETTQTYATVTLQNYFRMYHKMAGMTGTAETEASEFWEIYKLDVVVIPTNRPIVRDDREDLVFKTEREKYNAVINEIDRIVGQGRPVLVGTTTVDISERLSNLLNERGIPHNVLNAKQHAREADIVAEAGKAGKVTIATNMAGRGTDIKLSDEVKAAGGLAIVGTERHDSRRVDRQLRGRAGRQGDPGSSQFYVSLEDNLMRLFQSERIASLMDKMGHQDGEVIQHSMVSKSIERAQKKVEENNFGTRKRLLEYDDVMNIQREAIYKRRKNALSGERLSIDLESMFDSLTDSLVAEHRVEGGSHETFRRDCIASIGFEPEIDASDFEHGDIPKLQERLKEQFYANYHRKMNEISEFLMPTIQDVYNKEGNRYRRILVPFHDGSNKGLPIAAELEEAVNTRGKSIKKDIEKAVALALIDRKWMQHLRAMDELKESTQSASFEQKDPLVVYKMEAFEVFQTFIFDINERVTTYLSTGTLYLGEGETLKEAKQRQAAANRGRASKADGSSTAQQNAAHRAAQAVGQRERARPQTFKRVEKKVGRNEPCPCGSGKKYKQCHGKA